MQFSHHSSNPLEVRTSDSLNAGYHRALNKAQQELNPSSDELGRWSEKTEYQSHLSTVVSGLTIPPFRGTTGTPKTGPSRTGASYRVQEQRYVDLDEDMESEDELAQPYREEYERTPIAKNISKPSMSKPSENLMDEECAPLFTRDEEETLASQDEDTPLADEEEDAPILYEDQEYILVDDAQEKELGEPRADDWENGHIEDFNGDEDEDMRGDGSQLSSLSDLTPLSSNQSSPFSSPQSSRPASPDESLTLTARPPEEQEEILSEIEELYKSVPALEFSYALVDRLGTGTFSSVYKAVDLNYNEWDNQPWLGHHPTSSTAYYQSAGPLYKGRGGRAGKSRYTNDDPDGEGPDNTAEREDSGKVFVAIKRIYTTSGPERIRNELAIMEECRGCRHTSQIITAFRHKDQVVIVLPYQRNMDFRDFYQSLHPEGIKCYFRCLFRALRDIHNRGIIHRDVKPANFLYDPFTGIGTLCDFGLASRMEPGQSVGQCLHGPWNPKDPHGKNRTLDEIETMEVKRAQRAARAKSNMPADRVGYPDQDRRPVSKANRAGTRGFRAPEVLLKCGAQTGAIDVWSAGVILLFFLTGKFPIFQSNDDVEGLMEITVIIGKKKIERAATLHGRTIATNIPDLDTDGVSWQEFVERLNPDIWTPKKYDMRFYPHNSKHRDGRSSNSQPIVLSPSSEPPLQSTGSPEEISHASDRYANPRSIEKHERDMKHIFFFLEGVLHYESTKRFNPRRALYHNFLEEAGMGGDDEYVPLPPGEGVCKELHFRDYERDVDCVRIKRKCECISTKRRPSGEEYDVFDVYLSDEDDDDADRWCGEWVDDIVDLIAGQGVAIGKSPCEYHTDEFERSRFHQ